MWRGHSCPRPSTPNSNSLLRVSMVKRIPRLRLFRPIRKRLPRRIPERANQLPNSPAPLQQTPHQLLQLFPRPAIPLRRNFPRRRPHRIFFYTFNPREPRLKRLPSPHSHVHFVLRVNPAHRRIGKTPVPCVKTIPLVNKCDRVFLVPHFPPERRLPPIRVPRPLVERQHPGK